MEGKITLTGGKRIDKLLQLKQEKALIESESKENETFLTIWEQEKESAGIFHKIRSVDSIKKIDIENRSLKHEIENARLKNAGYSKELIQNLILTACFYLACIGVIAGVLFLDKLVFSHFENVYLLCGFYLLIHVGVYLLVFRIFRLAESMLGDHYIRIFHQLSYICSALIANFLMVTYLRTLTGLIVAGVSQLLIIIFTFVPGYKD